MTHVEVCSTDASRVMVSRKDGSTEVLDLGTGATAWGVNGNETTKNDVGCASAHWIMGEEERVVRVMEHGAAQVFSLDDKASNPLFEWTCPPKVLCSAYNASSRKLAVGCEGAELKVYSVSDRKGAACYAAKGGKPNSVGLCDRPCTSAVAFDPSVEDGTKVFVGTGSSKLRFYDANAGKRPQRDVPYKGFKITCLAPEQDGQRCWVGDGGGNLQVYDVRAAKFCGAVSGIGGSVRSMAIHRGAIVSGGLDRFLRVNSLRSRASLEKMYMKSQMTSVCWSRNPTCT